MTDGGDPTKTAALLQVKLALVTAQGQLSECVSKIFLKSFFFIPRLPFSEGIG